MAKVNKCARLLANVTGLVNQELLLQNEYLAAENRILRSHLPSRLRLSDPERETLAEIGKRLGRRALAQVACAAKPDTILRWYRKLIAQKFDGSKHRSYPGQPRISPEVEALIVRLASDQTVRNVLRRHGIEPAPKRGPSTRWNKFIRAHIEVLAGMDFFTVEVLTWSGLATYYVQFLIHLESRRITIAGITRHPTETWMEQMARNVTDESTGCLRDIRYVLHDRDTKFCVFFESILTAAGVKPLKLRHAVRI